MKEDFIHDIGIAALLHDVGKIFVPGELLKKESSLRAKESEAMKLHPLYGAQYLAKIDGLTHLAPIVAFEHHLRYDGLGPLYLSKCITSHALPEGRSFCPIN